MDKIREQAEKEARELFWKSHKIAERLNFCHEHDDDRCAKPIMDALLKLRMEIEELKKLNEWHKKDFHDAMEWKRELEEKLKAVEDENSGKDRLLMRMNQDADFSKKKIESLTSQLKIAMESLENISSLKEDDNKTPTLEACLAKQALQKISEVG